MSGKRPLVPVFRLCIASTLLLTGCNLFHKTDSSQSAIREVNSEEIELGCLEGCPSLKDLEGLADNADRAWIGIADISPLDANGKTIAANTTFTTHEEATWLRLQLLDAVRDFAAGQPHLKPWVTYETNGEKRIASEFAFGGCEGNLFQGQKDPTQDALRKCASFLLDKSYGAKLQLLIFGANQSVYASAAGMNWGNLMNGAAYFEKKNPMKPMVSLSVKPTGQNAISSLLPIPVAQGLSPAWAETLRKGLKLEKAPANINEISAAYLENRVQTLLLFPKVPTAMASVVLTTLTFNPGGTTSSAATLGTQASAIWGVINTATAVAGVLSDVAMIFDLERNVNMISDPQTRALAKAALVVVDTAAAVGSTGIAENPEKSLKNVKSAYHGVVDLALQKAVLSKAGVKKLSDLKPEQGRKLFSEITKSWPEWEKRVASLKPGDAAKLSKEILDWSNTVAQNIKLQEVAIRALTTAWPELQGGVKAAQNAKDAAELAQILRQIRKKVTPRAIRPDEINAKYCDAPLLTLAYVVSGKDLPCPKEIFDEVSTDIASAKADIEDLSSQSLAVLLDDLYQHKLLDAQSFEQAVRASSGSLTGDIASAPLNEKQYGLLLTFAQKSPEIASGTLGLVFRWNEQTLVIAPQAWEKDLSTGDNASMELSLWKTKFAATTEGSPDQVRTFVIPLMAKTEAN